MSFIGVVDFYRDELETLGFKEHTDNFDVSNIPQTVLTDTYHLEIGAITSGPSDHQPHKFDFPITLRLFFRGFSDANQARDDAINQAEAILDVLLAPSKRLDGTLIKDIVPLSINVEALSDSNDNDVTLRMDFNNKLVCNFP